MMPDMIAPAHNNHQRRYQYSLAGLLRLVTLVALILALPLVGAVLLSVAANVLVTGLIMGILIIVQVPIFFLLLGRQPLLNRQARP